MPQDSQRGLLCQASKVKYKWPKYTVSSKNIGDVVFRVGRAIVMGGSYLKIYCIRIRIAQVFIRQ
jgi:hypothetical protein